MMFSTVFNFADSSSGIVILYFSSRAICISILVNESAS